MRLAAFDLDGTLIRGQTAAEAIAEGIGRIERMREFELLRSHETDRVKAAIEEMAEWYSTFTFSELCKHLNAVSVAPGTEEGFALLREHGFKIAIVSLSWDFAVKWFANRLGADYWVGTGLSSSGLVTHFLPQDKAIWVTGLAVRLGIDMKDVAAVGDTRGDIPMLMSVGHRYWVGQTVPPELEGQVSHDPTGNMLGVARSIIEAQG